MNTDDPANEIAEEAFADAVRHHDVEVFQRIRREHPLRLTQAFGKKVNYVLVVGTETGIDTGYMGTTVGDDDFDRLVMLLGA
jgi:sugar/nucleoside kinase (ribokinase family)